MPVAVQKSAETFRGWNCSDYCDNMTLKSENSILSDDFVETNLRRFFVSEEADKSEKTKKPILYFVFVSVTNETLT